METKEIRRNNLRNLADAHVRAGTSKSDFASKIGMPASQLSQLTSRSGSKNMGDTIARRIESALDLHRGWMDVIHDDPSNVQSLGLVAPGSGGSFSLQNSKSNQADHPYRIERLDTEHGCGAAYVNNEGLDIIKSIEIDPGYAKRMFGGRSANTLKISTATGDSMKGTISPGELVVVDVTVNSFRSDGIYAFTYGDASHIKRLQKVKDRLLVISDNATYDRWEIGADDESNLQINGFVVGKWFMEYSRLG